MKFGNTTMKRSEIFECGRAVRELKDLLPKNKEKENPK